MVETLNRFPGSLTLVLILSYFTIILPVSSLPTGITTNEL